MNETIVKERENELKGVLLKFSQRTGLKKVFLEGDVQLRTTRTNGCENRCEMTYFYEDKELIGCMGNRCDDCIPKSLRRKIIGTKENNNPPQKMEAIN